MIQSHDIIDLGWKLSFCAANGGSKGFTRGKDLFVIRSNSDNFIFKRDNDPRLSEIVIQMIDMDTHKFIDLYIGHPETKQELADLIERYCK